MFPDENEEERVDAVLPADVEVVPAPSLPSIGRELLQSVVTPEPTYSTVDTTVLEQPSVSEVAPEKPVSLPSIGRELLQSISSPEVVAPHFTLPSAEDIATPSLGRQPETAPTAEVSEVDLELLSQIEDTTPLTPFYAIPDTKRALEVDHHYVDPYAGLIQRDPRPRGDADAEIKYTPRDLVERDDLYSVIEDFLSVRMGVHMRDRTREQNVASFISNRRSFDSRNAWTVISDALWTANQDDNGNYEAINTAMEAQKIWNNMAGFFSDEYTGEELQEAFVDYTKSLLLDPANLLSLWGGSVLAKTLSRPVHTSISNAATRAGQRAVERASATQALSPAAAEQLSRETRSRAIQKFTFGAGIGQSAAARQAAIQSGRSADSVRLWLSTGAVDGALAGGVETYYQMGLLNIGVQEEFNTADVGWAALTGLALPAAGAAYHGYRALTQPVAESLGVVRPGTIAEAFSSLDDPAVIARRTTQAEIQPVSNEIVDTLVKGLKDIADDIPVGDWQLSVARGRVQQGGRILEEEIKFWNALLLSDNGLAVALSRAGFGNTEGSIPLGKRFDGDKLTNHLADIMRVLPKNESDRLLKSLQEVGSKVFPEYASMSMDQFADALSYSMSVFGTGLSQMSMFGRKVNTLSEAFEEVAKDVTPAAAPGSKLAKAAKRSHIKGGPVNKVTGYLRYLQDYTIRAIVTHPGTTALNVKGYTLHEGVYAPVRDVIKMALYGGASVWEGVKVGGNPATNLNLLRSNFQAMQTRLYYMTHPDAARDFTQTIADFMPEVRNTLGESIYGGVTARRNSEEWVKKFGFDPMENPVTRPLEKVLEFFQKAYATVAQDMVTKHVSFTLNMDRLIRERFNMTPDKFFTSPNLGQMLQSKEYLELQKTALNMTQDAIASRSFSAGATGVPADMSTPKGFISWAATTMEAAKELPFFFGVNTMPFGRFTNNLINFMVESTPGGLVSYYSGVAYQGREAVDVYARSLAGSAIIAGLTYTAYDRLSRGEYLGYQQRMDSQGFLSDKRYEWPYSFFNGVAEAFAFKLHYGFDAELPPELSREIREHVIGAGVTRDLSETAKSMLTVVESFIGEDGDIDSGKLPLIQGAMGAYVASFGSATRMLEPLNATVAAIRAISGEGDQGVPDRRIGYQALNNALRYVDEPADMLLQSIADTNLITRARSAARQGNIPMSASVVSHRNLPPSTYTNWMLNSIGMPEWQLSVRSRAVPEAARHFNELFFYELEDKARDLFENKDFRGMSIERKDMIVRDIINGARSATKETFVRSDDGTDRKFSLMLSIAGPGSNNSRRNINRMLTDYFDGAEISDLEMEQLMLLDGMLKNIDLYIR